jgi:hypothetical protein
MADEMAHPPLPASLAKEVDCWGSGPAHVRVSVPLCGLEEFLVNTASTRGLEENNH